MAVLRTYTVTTTTPMKIIDADEPQAKMYEVTVRSGGTITFGDENVVSAHGPQLATGTPPPVKQLQVVDDDVFAIAVSSSATVDVLEYVTHPVE